MIETNGSGQIHEAMAAILDELPAIGKDSTNAALKFSFRGIDAIVNALNPLLGKHGVVPVLYSSALQRWEEKAKGYAAVVLNTYRFTARDGSFLQAVAIGEGHDFGDKAVSKANTMALKTCLGQVFCLAYEDDPDGDSVQDADDAQNEPAKKTGARKAARAAKQTGTTASPPAAEKVDPDLAKARDELLATVGELSENERGKLRGWLTGLEWSTDVDTYDVTQVAAVANYVKEHFEEPF